RPHLGRPREADVVPRVVVDAAVVEREGDGQRRVAVHEQVARRVHPLAPVPLRRLGVRLEPARHLKHGHEPPVCEAHLTTPTLRGRVDDGVAGAEAGGEVAAPAGGGDGGGAVLEIGLATGEAVDVRRQPVLEDGLPPAGRLAQRPVGAEVGARRSLVVVHSNKLGTRRASAASAGRTARPAPRSSGALSPVPVRTLIVRNPGSGSADAADVLLEAATARDDLRLVESDSAEAMARAVREAAADGYDVEI